MFFEPDAVLVDVVISVVLGPQPMDRKALAWLWNMYWSQLSIISALHLEGPQKPENQVNAKMV